MMDFKAAPYTPELRRIALGKATPGDDWKLYVGDDDAATAISRLGIDAMPFVEIDATEKAALPYYHAAIVVGSKQSELPRAEAMANAVAPFAMDTRIIRLKKMPADAAEMVKMALAAEIFTPPAPGPILKCLSDVERKAITWVWQGKIPAGRITLWVGRPGEGKSFASLDVVARITTGSPWPDGSGFAPKGSVILVGAEDDAGDTVGPRCDACGADSSKIHLMTGVRRMAEDGKTWEVAYSLENVAALEEALRRLPDCKMVVIDPIGSVLGGGTDAHRDNEVRAILAPIAALAEKHGAAILMIAHRRKSAGTVADDLALGSRAFTGIARAVWHISRDKQDKRRRLFLPGKNNLAMEGDGLAFSIEGDPPSVCWERDPVQMDADDGLAAENDEPEKPGPEPKAREAATEWLANLMASGEVAVAKVKEEAKGAGLAWRTIQRAADGLGVVREKNSFGGGWQWRLLKVTDPTCQVEVTDVP
jgi:hypothetical protein